MRRGKLQTELKGAVPRQSSSLFNVANYSPSIAMEFTALFTNMRILKFKSQLTIGFFAAVNHVNGLLRK